MLFFSTFITGLHEPVTDVLKRRLKNSVILNLFDGAVLYKADSKQENVITECFNNTFQVLNYSKAKKQNALEFMAEKALAEKNVFSRGMNFGRHRTFRLVTSSENQLTAINNNVKHRLETMISNATRLKPDRAKADIEFWLLYRSEGYVFFLQRLTTHRSYDKLLNKGELHPELAYIMNWLALPKDSDVVLDPFCGYGSIPYQRLLYFKAEKIFAFDCDKDKVQKTKEKLKSVKSRSWVKELEVKTLDVRDITIPGGTVDKIITDPPWGQFSDMENIADFYYEMLKIFSGLLKKSGKLVLLTSCKNELQEQLKKFGVFKIEKEYHILVSGKKAGLYVIGIR